MHVITITLELLSMHPVHKPPRDATVCAYRNINYFTIKYSLEGIYMGMYHTDTILYSGPGLALCKDTSETRTPGQSHLLIELCIKLPQKRKYRTNLHMV